MTVSGGPSAVADVVVARAGPPWSEAGAGV